MPIITKPSSIQKNSPAEISLDKSALAAVTSVAASAYYSDSANWKEVFIYYKSSVGNQREVLKFNATISSPVATFLVSEKARDIFEVQKIVIVDFDNGSITVPRSQLTVVEFDVDMTPPPASGIPFQLTTQYEVLTPAINPTYLENQTNDRFAPATKAISTTSIGAINSGVANFDITFNLSNFSNTDDGGGAGTEVGLYCTDTPPELIDLSINLDVVSGASPGIVALIYGAYPGTNIRSLYDPFAAYWDGGEIAHLIPLNTVRIKQTGNTLEFYRNGTLRRVVDTSSSSVSKLYMYPFIYATGRHTVESVIVNEV